MTANPDRLFELLPGVIRARDAGQQYPLRDLLRVIGEQVDLLEYDIRRMYDNLFIETCEQWVVPYLGDLVGYRPMSVPTEDEDACTDVRGDRFLIPRRIVADTVALRRRKGTLSVLEDLAVAVTGWATIVEEKENATEVISRIWRRNSWPLNWIRPFYVPRRTNCFTFSVLGNNVPLHTRAELADENGTRVGPSGVPQEISRDLLAGDLDRYYGPNKSLCIFENGHPISPGRIDVRNLVDWPPDVGDRTVAVDPELGRIMFPERYRLRRLTVSYHYGFAASVGGGEYPRPIADNRIGASLFRPGHLVGHGEPLRAAIAAGATPFATHIRSLVDPDALAESDGVERRLCSELNRIMQAHDLGEEPLDPSVELDDETMALLEISPRGPRRIRLNRLLLEAGFPDAIARAFGGVRVEPGTGTQIIMDAVRSLQSSPRPPIHMVVELTDSGLYVEPVVVDLPPGHTFELRAAEGCRPTIALSERSADIDDMVVTCGRSSRVILDGLMVSRHAVRIVGNPAGVAVRHCTLVPGWEIDDDCQPCCGEEPSLVLTDVRPFEHGDHGADDCLTEWLVGTRVTIDRSIVGTVIVQRDEVDAEPARLDICRSIVDATDSDDDAIAAPNQRPAHAVLSLVSSTVIGRVRTHAIELVENSILVNPIEVERRQVGCPRFSYIPPDSRTPPRHECQPTAQFSVDPTFMDPDLRYGRPDYCRLADDCAVEIREGADDESEMGVYHDLFQPQRAANLTAALQDYLPIGWTMTHSFES